MPCRARTRFTCYTNPPPRTLDCNENVFICQRQMVTMKITPPTSCCKVMRHSCVFLVRRRRLSSGGRQNPIIPRQQGVCSSVGSCTPSVERDAIGRSGGAEGAALLHLALGLQLHHQFHCDRGCHLLPRLHCSLQKPQVRTKKIDFNKAIYTWGQSAFLNRLSTMLLPILALVE